MATTEPHVLGGRYELGEVLGFGGMAEVFRGRDVRLGRDVAVKVLRADLARDPSFLGRFRREAQAAAGLNHPNVVGVYDTGEEDGTPYIVMEFVSGRTLREVLADDGRLLPRRALEITSEVCSALEFSHRAGIVHRDIKPANVMLTRTGEVKVMDFGIARAGAGGEDTMTQTSQVLGTAQYLSPEQARGEHVDARSDIYSAGCLLYELLTGVPPFQGESPVAVAYQHVREDPTPPSVLDPDLPAALDAVVLKAMAKNAANRYQTAAEFGADLDRAAAGRRVEAGPVLAAPPTTSLPAAASTTVLLRPDRREQRGRRITAYIALVAAVIIVFVVAAVVAKHLVGGTSSAVNVPNYVGQTQAVATANIKADGFTVDPKVTMTPDGSDGNTLAAGLVYKTSPSQGFTLKKGQPITLFVSIGVATLKVPNVVGQSTAAAQAALSQAGFNNVTVNVDPNANGTPGNVTKTVPAAGAAAKATSPVTIFVVPSTKQVPNVINEPQQEAEGTLAAAGFQVATTSQLSSTVPEGSVIAQTPNGGAVAAPGATVTLTISSGPPNTPTPTLSPSLTPTPTDSASTSPSSSTPPSA